MLCISPWFYLTIQNFLFFQAYRISKDTAFGISKNMDNEQNAQKKLSEAIKKSRELKAKIFEIRTELAKKNDAILLARQAERQVLQKALHDFDQATRELQAAADKETMLQKSLDELDSALALSHKAAHEALAEVEMLPPFAFADQDTGIIVSLAKESRSAGISLKSVTAALVKAGTFKTLTEAEKTIKAFNLEEKAILSIRSIKDGSVVDVDKEFGPRPTKRARK
jgi:hypothetical protein